MSVRSAAPPSATTLQALSEYCASSDSPSSSAFDFGHTTIVHTEPVSAPDTLASDAELELADIILESARFQTPAVQQKMQKALKHSASMGFAPTHPGEGSTQVTYGALPPSPGDCFFNDTSLAHTSTSLRAGLPPFVPSPSPSEPCLLSPGASCGKVSTDGISSGFTLSPPPAVRTVQRETKETRHVPTDPPVRSYSRSVTDTLPSDVRPPLVAKETVLQIASPARLPRRARGPQTERRRPTVTPDGLGLSSPIVVSSCSWIDSAQAGRLVRRCVGRICHQSTVRHIFCGGAERQPRKLTQRRGDGDDEGGDKER
ncbi:hypothetical protein FB451DRAFT_1556483 [Mycena latifolia]|nr:hypothetical protein FB451DRAFT_1556483 [Mycena latifolia]